MILKKEWNNICTLIKNSLRYKENVICKGVINKLTKKYDAVTLVKIASEILGGKGGGGRKDFAQAGGLNKDKIKDAFGNEND